MPMTCNLWKSSTGHSFEDCLRRKLFVMSLVAIISAIYQFVFMSHIRSQMYYKGACSSSHDRLYCALSHYTYYYVPSDCGDKTLLDFYDESSDNVGPNAAEFVKAANNLGNKQEMDNVWTIFTVWIVQDIILIIFSIPLFSVCFFTKVAYRNMCKYIFFPWIVVVTLIVISDLVVFWIILIKLASVQLPSNWVVYNGFSEEQAKAFEEFDEMNDEEINYALIYMPVRLLFLTVRHVITIPAFIFFVGILAKDSVKIYKKSRVRHDGSILSLHEFETPSSDNLKAGEVERESTKSVPLPPCR